MHRPLVKICGITNLPDALAAAALGADFLGFIFAENSPRRVTRETARTIIAALPEKVRTVGVFVNSPMPAVAETLADCGLDIAQLHGDESAENARLLGVERVWKAFHLTGAADLAAAADFPAAAILADTMLPGQRGGTGIVGDWELARQLARRRNLVLAGGVKPGNIAEAARLVAPYAIDIGSGVEAAPGRKDHRKLQQLFAIVDHLEP